MTCLPMARDFDCRRRWTGNIRENESMQRLRAWTPWPLHTRRSCLAKAHVQHRVPRAGSRSDSICPFWPGTGRVAEEMGVDGQGGVGKQLAWMNEGYSDDPRVQNSISPRRSLSVSPAKSFTSINSHCTYCRAAQSVAALRIADKKPSCR